MPATTRQASQPSKRFSWIDASWSEWALTSGGAVLQREQIARIQEPQRVQPPLHRFHRFDLRRRILQREQMGFAFAKAMFGRYRAAQRYRLPRELDHDIFARFELLLRFRQYVHVDVCVADMAEDH